MSTGNRFALPFALAALALMATKAEEMERWPNRKVPD